MMDVPKIVQLIEAPRSAYYKAAESGGITGCETAMALEYTELLAIIDVQSRNFEKPMEMED